MAEQSTIQMRIRNLLKRGYRTWDPDQNLKVDPGDPAVVLDVETTGLDFGQDRMVSLGLCQTDTLQRKYWRLHTDGIASNPQALATHGIQLKTSNRSPRLESVWPDVERFCAGRPILAHNASFDFKFIKHSLDRNGIFCSGNFHRRNWRDTLKIARLCFSERKFHTLDDLVEYVGLEVDERGIHSAVEDAVILARCWNSPVLAEKWQEVPERLRNQAILENLLAPMKS